MSDKDLQFCLKKTRFNKKTILSWFKNFRSECPNGKLSRSHLYGKMQYQFKTEIIQINYFQFTELFSKIFPTGNAESFCDHIFRIFDSDGNNFLDFKEYLMALDIAQCTDERQKLEWSFRLEREAYKKIAYFATLFQLGLPSSPPFAHPTSAEFQF